MTQHVKLTLNGQLVEADIEPRLLLVHFIREVANLTGTHIGCDTTSCGACTVQINGVPSKSCTLFAVQMDGADIRTVEGLEQDGQLSPIQEGFFEEHGLQCGFCTPGMMITAVALLEQNGALAPIQEGFFQEHGLQCGFCTPGMMMTATALLARTPNPSEAEIRQAISGNLCRCTGYVNIVKSIQHAAKAMQAAPVPAGAGAEGGAA